MPCQPASEEVKASEACLNLNLSLVEPTMRAAADDVKGRLAMPREDKVRGGCGGVRGHRCRREPTGSARWTAQRHHRGASAVGRPLVCPGVVRPSQSYCILPNPPQNLPRRSPTSPGGNPGSQPHVTLSALQRMRVQSPSGLKNGRPLPPFRTFFFVRRLGRCILSSQSSR